MHPYREGDRREEHPMHMSGTGGALSVPSEHLPGLVALIAVAVGATVAVCTLRLLANSQVRWAERAMGRWHRLPLAGRAALFGVLVGAAVHAALVPTHWSDERTTALLFLADAAGFAIAAAWILCARRRWPEVALGMLGGTTVVYAWYLLSGREDADLVGLLTTTVELAAALIVVTALLSTEAMGGAGRPRRRQVTAAGATLVALLAMGALVLASPTTPTADANASPTTSAPSGSMGSMTGSASSTRPLSLATTSPAGPIAWPDDMSTMAPGMTMATPNCTAQPTKAQQHAAVDLVDRTVAAARPYQSLAAAKAAGYVPVTPSGKRVVHYINPAVYREKPTVDPTQIPVLVYVNTPHGAVLSAAMYLMPRTTASPPQPGGCLTQWHIHTDLCFQGGSVVGADDAGGCRAGSANRTTTPMMHVWLTPVSGGPLAPDPAARDEVLAAEQVPLLATPNGIA
jgi:hypothetical protein